MPSGIRWPRPAGSSSIQTNSLLWISRTRLPPMHSPKTHPVSHKPATRREFLWNLGGGLGGIALAQLLADERLLAADPHQLPASVRQAAPPRAARARRVVQLFMSGAASQCDTFDYKPELIRLNGKPFDPGEKVEL